MEAVCMCMCVCVCVWAGVRDKINFNSDRLIPLVPISPIGFRSNEDYFFEHKIWENPVSS